MARWLTYLKSPWTLILLISVALFTFWGGPVFTAPTLSQGGRLLVSYLFIPAAVAAVLIWRRRWDWSSFGYHTVSLALMKMVITMTVHLWVVPRGERMQAGALPAPPGARDHYQGHADGLTGGVVGKVKNGRGAASGFVALQDIKSGKIPTSALHSLTLAPHGFSPSVVVATVRDEIRLASLDSLPHTFVLSDSSGQVLQMPLPPGHSGNTRTLLRTGFFQSRCSFDHPDETVPIWVFDHPYHALLDSAGMFRLDQVPEGTFHLGAWTAPGLATPSATQEIRVRNGRIDTVEVILNSAIAGRE